jgi:hypothetical protein
LPQKLQGLLEEKELVTLESVNISQKLVTTVWQVNGV